MPQILAREWKICDSNPFDFKRHAAWAESFFLLDMSPPGANVE
jgi:hypothetical protein